MYDINRPSPSHKRKYTSYKMVHSMMMVICIKQHLSNIWSSIHETCMYINQEFLACEIFVQYLFKWIPYLGSMCQQ